MKIRKILNVFTAALLAVMLLASCGSSSDVQVMRDSDADDSAKSDSADKSEKADTTKAEPPKADKPAETTTAATIAETTDETTVSTEPPAPVNPDILPLTIKSGSNSVIEDVKLGGINYSCYLTQDNKFYVSAGKQEATLLFENVRDIDHYWYSSNDYVVILKDDNSLWAFGTNFAGELGPKTEAKNDDGYIVELDYYPPEKAVMVAENVANLEYDGYISTDKVLYGLYEGIAFTNTGITNAVKIESGTVLHATGELYYYGSDYRSEGEFLASDVKDILYFESWGWYCAFVNTDNQLILIEGVESSVLAEDGVDYYNDYYDGLIEFILKSDGTLWAKGRNEDGVLGDGSKTDREEFVQIAENVSHIAPEYWVYLKEDGTLYTWYENAEHYAYSEAKFKYLDNAGRLVDTEGNEWQFDFEYSDPYGISQKKATPQNPQKNLILPSEEIYNG
jgi:hypothetical protein